MYTDFRYWLPFLTDDVPAELTSPADVARFELDQALPASRLMSPSPLCTRMTWAMPSVSPVMAVP